jgi:hypothetical protein
MPALPGNAIDFEKMRRLIHLVLLVVIIVAVRACGGAVEAEDRLGVASRWLAEKTGMTQAMDAWNANVRPRVAAVTESTSGAIYRTVSVALDNAESAADGIAAWIADEVTRVVRAAKTTLRSVFTPKRPPEPAAASVDGPPPPPPLPPPPGKQQPAPVP